mmetsp:Transcript_4175/g.13221  ORF Transcript_4175/g.13221 Transcript_4175/m.13221 type:complete len:591 (+) Transcript_4175:352-2124(+)
MPVLGCVGVQGRVTSGSMSSGLAFLKSLIHRQDTRVVERSRRALNSPSNSSWRARDESMKPVLPPTGGMTLACSRLTIWQPGWPQKLPSWCQYSAARTPETILPSVLMLPIRTISRLSGSRFSNENAAGSSRGSPTRWASCFICAGSRSWRLTQMMPCFQILCATSAAKSASLSSSTLRPPRSTSTTRFLSLPSAGTGSTMLGAGGAGCSCPLALAIAAATPLALLLLVVVAILLRVAIVSLLSHTLPKLRHLHLIGLNVRRGLKLGQLLSILRLVADSIVVDKRRKVRGESRIRGVAIDWQADGEVDRVKDPLGLYILALLAHLLDVGAVGDKVGYAGVAWAVTEVLGEDLAAKSADHKLQRLERDLAGEEESETGENVHLRLHLLGMLCNALGLLVISKSLVLEHVTVIGIFAHVDLVVSFFIGHDDASHGLVQRSDPGLCGSLLRRLRRLALLSSGLAGFHVLLLFGVIVAIGTGFVFDDGPAGRRVADRLETDRGKVRASGIKFLIELGRVHQTCHVIEFVEHEAHQTLVDFQEGAHDPKIDLVRGVLCKLVRHDPCDSLAMHNSLVVDALDGHEHLAERARLGNV